MCNDIGTGASTGSNMRERRDYSRTCSVAWSIGAILRTWSMTWNVGNSTSAVVVIRVDCLLYAVKLSSDLCKFTFDTDSLVSERQKIASDRALCFA